MGSTHKEKKQKKTKKRGEIKSYLSPLLPFVLDVFPRFSYSGAFFFFIFLFLCVHINTRISWIDRSVRLARAAATAKEEEKEEVILARQDGRKKKKKKLVFTTRCDRCMRKKKEREEGKKGKLFLVVSFCSGFSSSLALPKFFLPCLLSSVSRKNRSKDERDLRLAGAQAENKEMIAPIRTSIYRTDEKEVAETAFLWSSVFSFVFSWLFKAEREIVSVASFSVFSLSEC